jgi:hypothetical protein
MTVMANPSTIPPPLPILATHLIRVIIPDYSHRDADLAIDPDYSTTPVMYIGIVEQSAGIETDAGAIYSVGTFDVVVFSVADPGIRTQAGLEWAEIPDDYPLPARVTGAVDTPDGWAAEKVAMVEGDASKMGNGCWKVSVKAKS